jgi:hypothetical protein
MLKRLEYTSKYSGVAQWWSKKLLTSRLPVRVRPPEPDQAEKSADLVPRPDLTSLLGQTRTMKRVKTYDMLEPSERAVLSFYPCYLVLTQPLPS